LIYYRFILLSVCISFSLLSSCQSSKSVTSNKQTSINYLVDGAFSILDSDNLGNLYLVNEDNELLQYDSDLNPLYEFSVNTLGDIGSIDVSNPQKILIYYPDFQFIVFVDNTLSEIKRLNLENMNFWDVQGVALSNDNLIWIYDPINYRLIKIDEAGNIKLSSNESFFGELGDVFRPQVYAQNSSVYLYNNKEFMIFDLFGQHIKTIQIDNEKVQFLDSQIMVLSENELNIVELGLTRFEDVDNKYYSNSDIDIVDFTISEKTLYLLSEGGVLRGE